MKLKGVNSSSLKTKKKIKEEFANLVYEKQELSKITVSELVKRIDITRGAFYSHYDNIYNVAKEFQNDALSMIEVNINSYDEILTFFDLITEHLKFNDTLYSAILKCDESLIFMDRLTKLTTQKLTAFLKINNSYQNLDFDIRVFTYGIVQLYIKYFRNETNYSLDEINNNIKLLFQKMFIEKSCINN
jgi:hypothetical protein